MPENYDGDSLKELPEWIESAKAKGFAKAAKGPLDDRVAQEVAEQLNPLIYVAGEGFLNYKEGHWQNFSESAFDRTSKQLVQPYLKASQQVGPYLQNIRKCAALNLERQGFGDYSSKICLKNGTVDVRTGELLEWSPDHELRYRLDLDFDPEAKCPLYEEQVQTTLCNDEKAIAVFEEYAGLTLIPDMSFQKALYCVGTGGSGKSTLLKLVESMHCPDAVSVTPLDKIDTERYLTDLARKLVCISFDIQTKQSVFGEAFVRITGGDLVATRKLYHEVDGRVKPTVRFLGSMNPDMPTFIASPDALERRLIFLKCGQKVGKPDRQRVEKLLLERPGILNRWIKALQRLLERGEFDLPENSTMEVQEYVNTQDPVQVYVREQLVLDSTGNTTANEVLIEYNAWADAANERKLSANVLGRKLKAAGVKMEYGSITLPNGDRKSVRMYKVRFRHQSPLQKADY